MPFGDQTDLLICYALVERQQICRPTVADLSFLTKFIKYLGKFARESSNNAHNAVVTVAKLSFAGEILTLVTAILLVG